MERNGAERDGTDQKGAEERCARCGVDNFVDGRSGFGGGPQAPDSACKRRLVQVVVHVEEVVVLAADAVEARLAAAKV